MDKILSGEKMAELSEAYRASGQTVVFTNGCFDILHAGHAAYLAMAADQGDILVVGLNSDASVKQIKGDKRPVIGQDHRARVLAALEAVSHVVLFDEAEPGNLIRAVCPDVLVKGADWPEDQIIGADFVKSRGGRVVRVAFEHDISTTAIIERIKRLCHD